MNLDIIAKKAGVSRMTVSRALRNHPEVSDVTRQKVLAIAKELDYRPNPIVSVLMSQIANSRKPSFRPTLVYAWEHSKISKDAMLKSKGSYFNSAVKRADELGFNLEPMRINESNMSHKRFSDIIVARNTPGLIIAPQEKPEGYYSFNWEAFSTVAIGYSIRSPRLHRVCLNYHIGIFKALKTLWDQGFRSFGLLLMESTDQRILHLWTSGFLTFHWEQGISCDDRILITDDLYYEESMRWFRKKKPEVILSYEDGVFVEWVREFEAQEGEAERSPCQFIHLDADYVTRPQNLLASVQSCRSIMGATAVDLLVAQIKRNEVGLPATPKTMVVDPELIFY